MGYPRASGDRRIFRDDFLNLGMTIGGGGSPVGAALINRGLSGGQVMYYGPAHSVRYAGAVSIASNVVISASGANQALWSIGTAASRRMEVGIDATGRPYAWGTAQVLLGTAVSDGHHDLGFSIGSDGSVWCVVDGELWGSGTVTFGSTFDRMLVGGSCLGTLPWAGETKDIHIYRGQMDEAQMAHAMGATVGFQPESLLVGRTGQYTNLSLPNAVVNNTQPNIVNGSFLSDEPPGAAWTRQVNWVVSGGQATASTFLATLTQAVAIVGNHYLASWQNISGSADAWIGGSYSGVAANGRELAFREASAGATSFGIRCASNPGTSVVDDFVGWNLSSRQLTCQGNLGHWQELVAANMPWGSDSRAPTSKPVNGRRALYWETTRRFSTGPSKASTRWLHDGTGCTLAFVFKTSLPAAAAFLINNLGNGLSVGSDLWIGPGGTIEWRTANALGAATYSLQATSAAGVIVANTMTLVTVRMNAVNGAIVRKNGVQVAIDPTPVSFGAGDSSYPLAIGGQSVVTAYGLQGSVLVPDFMVNAWITDDELDRLERHFSNYAGIP